jgi:TetR/AcrR family fatty acid metabolism transcriptional regulator
MMSSPTAPRSWKEKQRQEREALILQTAEEVFCEKGYHESSIDEIAARVGIAKGTVYLHFPSKEDLVAALIERDSRHLLQAVEDINASTQTTRAKLEAILRLMYGELLNKRMRLFYAMYNSSDMRLLTEKKASMHSLWEEVARHITSLLDEGKAAGDFDSTIPTSVMLSLFLNLISVRGYERLVRQEHLTPDEVLQYLTRIYFKGIAAEPSL